MAKKENPYKGYGINTQAIHTGTDYDQETGAVRRPLHMANSYKLPDDLSKVNYSSTDLLMYSRNGNANQHWLEEKIAALHEADDAIVLASGVGALHALFWTLLKTGDRVVYPKVSYMAVYRMFHELFNRKFGVETVMVDMTDLAVSLGHDESLIFPQPSYDERIGLYPEKFRKGFIRFSVGLEEPEDIIEDLDQAFRRIGL